MQNAMDSLGIDPNSLMAYDAFNWDCVDGMDDVYKHIMKVYESVITSLASRLDDCGKTIQSVQGAVTKPIIDNLSEVSSVIADTHSKIATGLSGKLATVGSDYASPGQALQWYIVYRQRTCGNYVPSPEQLSVSPSGYEWYGPYADPRAIPAVMETLGSKVQDQIVMGGDAEQRILSQGVYDNTTSNLALVNPAEITSVKDMTVQLQSMRVDDAKGCNPADNSSTADNPVNVKPLSGETQEAYNPSGQTSKIPSSQTSSIGVYDLDHGWTLARSAGNDKWVVYGPDGIDALQGFDVGSRVEVSVDANLMCSVKVIRNLSTYPEQFPSLDFYVIRHDVDGSRRLYTKDDADGPCYNPSVSNNTAGLGMVPLTNSGPTIFHPAGVTSQPAQGVTSNGAGGIKLPDIGSVVLGNPVPIDNQCCNAIIAAIDRLTAAVLSTRFAPRTTEGARVDCEDFNPDAYQLTSCVNDDTKRFMIREQFPAELLAQDGPLGPAIQALADGMNAVLDDPYQEG